ncbi:E3 ubiquitin-protein ligase At1g12760-like [Cucurbita pepo subsp. pepo]|uniref:E3 ubiquitin-protein ligase At1g12760-like n=1 Tax=Cucurbita pepo subsp. pepo TaxID=3664 RepID=UPI000C9D78B5|nr:E3 ubiquitin-protein ligase At1g12760-like [Cucurbita pepo subsp. pepo]
MASSRSPNGSSDNIVDSTPLMGNPNRSLEDGHSGRRFVQRQSLRQAARFLRQATSRRALREPSLLVRETAAEQLEERQNDWACSKPVVILDILWNFAFVVVAATVLLLSRRDSPTKPLRLWILGYALQCILHMVSVCVEYYRRLQRRFLAFNSTDEGNSARGISGLGPRGNSSHYPSLAQLDDNDTSVAKHLESANTMFSFIWWIIGFYWVSAGGRSLAHASPLLFWLCIIFLGFDVFFVVLCVALACIIGIAVCCCLPCIIALLYAVADQEGATKEDIEQLSKFKFRKLDDAEKFSADLHEPLGGIMTECGTDSPIEHALSQEDAECCICLSAYDDGVELQELPCGHHFHCSCVDKWLYINATCPLCKYNILKNSNLAEEEV